MADFMDSEAEESENEGSEIEEDVDVRSAVHSKKHKRRLQLESDEEDDEDDGEEVKDLIDDNPIEEDDSDIESVDSGRKRKKSDDDDDNDSDDRLEDEDYDLLEENLGVKVQRKKFKRLKRIQDEDSDEGEAQDREGDREVIANQLFEGSDNEEEHPPVERDETAEHFASESEGEYSETDDFIVDDEGRPITEKRKKRKPIFTDTTLQEAQDIFGVDFDYDEFEKYDEEYYEEEEEEDEYEDEERTIRKTKKSVRKKRKPKTIYEIYEPSELERAGFTDEDNRIRNQDVPERMQLRTIPVIGATEEELNEEAEWIYEIAFNSNLDSTKAPEKSGPGAAAVSVAAKSVTNTGEDNWEEDWDGSATTVAPTVVTAPAAAAKAKSTTGGEENWDEDWETGSAAGGGAIPPPPATSIAAAADNDWDDGGTVVSKAVTARSELNPAEDFKARTIPKIRKALDFMKNQHLEVPFIAFYRKEYVAPELGINDLWTIYRLDARFCQLKTRKTRLNILFQNMRDYQTDYILAHADEPILESMRVISDTDLDRIKSIRNPEELKDIYMQFTLYYANDVQPMKEALLKKEKERRRKAKEAAAMRDLDEDGVEIPKEVEEEEPMPENEEGGLKRKIGGGPYAFCRKLGIDSFAKKFGLSPSMFAENLRDNYQRHEVDQYPSEPLEVAKEYISPRLSSAEEVIRAGKFMVSTQISREPLVRQTIREVLFERATIAVTPTKKGLKEIDEAHPAYGMKYLKEKPVRELTGDQFLVLTMAEEDKLLTIKLGENIRGITMPNFIDEVKQLYHKDEFSKNVQDWNLLRGECVEFALEKLLFPPLRKELRAKLLDKCREHILKACSQKLHNWIKVAPYNVSFPDEEDEDWDTSKGIRVLAIAFVPDLSQASFACLINPDGEPSDYLRLQNIIKYKNAYRESDRLEKESDLTALKNFIVKKKPHVIVVGGESREAIMIKEDLQALVGDLCAQEGFPQIGVEIYDNEQAKVYANSIKAQNDFREYPLILRQAVSLGRRIQDPLVEFSQLCTADDEILCLRFHPLQDQVSKEEFLEHLQLEFVNQTNEVGVDVNRAISCPHTSNLVQFVCGLGPRKALALIKTLKQNNQRLENRTQLITVCHMGPKIFINCSGFIKIDTNSLGDSTEAYVEVLDGSRVHPETYEWARKMAVDALEYDDEDANPAGALEEILEAPERLRDLDLDAFAEELDRQGFGNKSITLYDIREELNHRYKDLRPVYRGPSPEELFNMLTKETPDTLYIGKLITANVAGITHKKPQGDQLDTAVPVRNEETGMWQCAFCMKNDFPDLSEVWNHFDAGGCPGQATGVRIRLDNGITGFIPINKLSDKEVTNPENRVKRGQTIHCRVVKIDVERFSVECTSRTSDLVDKNNEWKMAKDPFYDQETEDKERKKEEDLKKLKHRQTYVKRVIVHPSFKNISYKDAEKLMEQMDQGEVIVRPSSKGADHLTVTWKVADGVYQHIDVREEGKENAFSLGQSLWIGTEEFEDLDEIIARHVNPMAAYARDIMSFKYYKNIPNRVTAEEQILEERRKSGNKIHYVLFAAKDFPGKFVLSYLPKAKVHHEYITVTPEGFRFRQQNFDTLNQLFKWFKEHYRDPLPGYNASTPRVPVGVTPSVYGGMAGANQATPYTTPAQNFTPFARFSSQTPYTPTQTPYLTPFTTPYQSTTPRFLPPGAATPKTPTQFTQRLAPRSSAASTVGVGNSSSETLDWRKAAEAWAKSQQKGHLQNTMGAGARSGTRNAAQVIIEGIEKTKQLSSAHNFLTQKSPRSAYSTPGTNFSPRSMIESSLGEETPLYDE